MGSSEATQEVTKPATKRKRTKPKPATTKATKARKSSKRPLTGLRATKRNVPKPKSTKPKSTTKRKRAPKSAPPPVVTPGLRTRAGGRETRRITIYLPPTMVDSLEAAAFKGRTTMSALAEEQLAPVYGAGR